MTLRKQRELTSLEYETLLKMKDDKIDQLNNERKGVGRECKNPFDVINELADRVYSISKNKGWWENERMFPECVALMHSELSEALEEYRNANPDIYYSQKGDDDKKPEGIGVELADVIIRILDFCAKDKIDIGHALKIKIDYNEGRPYRHGGKVC